MINIKYITANDNEFDIVKAIRSAVFTNEQGADALSEFDKYDSADMNTNYALMYDCDIPVATARIALTDKGYKIGRIAVLKEYRGKGYGDIIVRSVTQKVFSMGADIVFVDAQNYAVPFYEKIGFKVIGDEIMDRGLPHMPMSISKGELNVKKEQKV